LDECKTAATSATKRGRLKDIVKPDKNNLDTRAKLGKKGGIENKHPPTMQPAFTNISCSHDAALRGRRNDSKTKEVSEKRKSEPLKGGGGARKKKRPQSVKNIMLAGTRWRRSKRKKNNRGGETQNARKKKKLKKAVKAEERIKRGRLIAGQVARFIREGGWRG